uniref:Uncharacterized protein n=1 Tax=Klebsiella phage FKP3 TaxID=3231233 RepID=A0AAU8HZ82_9CAUD
MPTPKRIDYVNQERKLFFHWYYQCTNPFGSIVGSYRFYLVVSIESSVKK